MNKKGFTFIEMLVVVTIIGILTAVGVTNFRVANQRARDGKRQADLEQIRAALELYRTDENVYPDGDIVAAEKIIGPISSTVYMDPLPVDPDSDNNYFYYSSDGTTYKLCAFLELTTDGPPCTAFGESCGVGISCNYQVESPQ